jgi:hypothetical protein
MTYVPVNLWVPDTPEGPTTDSVNLKACDTCKAAIPTEFMDEHVSGQHSQEVTPH